MSIVATPEEREQGIRDTLVKIVGFAIFGVIVWWIKESK